MTYFQMLKMAKAAKARQDQLALIKKIRKIMAEPVRTRFGVVKHHRDESVKKKLGCWLTALQTGHKEDEFWQEAAAQAEKSLLVVNNPRHD